ncbi:hypothetical protein [Pseudoalteromonas denitrificans]|uniref:Uncharacterized protein n=1 Tax=Pseudoalteromonas denitrificans DSM 6059 TaxID=1123010 RepID=A0A1I1SSC9_9GAMM|nr:hypothetical protein [Pseudoalteromonas denitrificans]SFD49316.1 hypothetical protein SAMN02745724_04675 [Pseudoalteromonas denitrificans DSM 6059]
MKEIIKAVFPIDIPSKDAKNATKILFWIIAFAITMVLPNVAIKLNWFDSNLLIMMSVIFHGITGIGVVLAYKRFLKELDELERKIQFDALVVALGTALVSTSVYAILKTTGLVGSVNLSIIIMLISVTYAVSLIIGRVRYR